ncbi:sensor histidine kinase [Bacillus marinisedimentorum]|uniref:sensor histidine kinase n=1 Tax=Bacillus marinisedimentorum TaxID=1821260 RepID=UPI000872C4B7|nr:PAS domain-containing sensor histidine kinase [Bacillus marinisedimentorum]
MLNRIKTWSRTYFFQISAALVTLVLISSIIIVVLLDINMSDKMKEVQLSKHEEGAEASYFVLEPQLYGLIDKLADLERSYPDFRSHYMQDGKEYLDTSEGFTSLFFINKFNGKIDWLSGSDNRIEGNIPDLDAIKKAYNGEYSFSGRYEAGNQDYILVAGPVHDNGVITGVLGGAVSLDHNAIFQRSLKPLEKDTMIYLLDKNGKVLGTNSPVIQDYRVNEEVYRILEEKNDVQSGLASHFDDGTNLYSYYPLDDLDWSMVIQTPNKYIYEPVEEVRRYNFLVLLLILFFSILFAALIAARMQRPILDLISQIKHSKGKPLPHQVSVKGNTELETLVDVYNTFSHDMHEEQQKRFAQQKVLLQNEKLATVGRLSAGIVHEIRNPLTPIRGFLQLIRTDVSKDKIQYVDLAIDELDRANMLVNSLLEFSRPGNEKQKMLPVNLNELFEQVNLLVEANLYKKNILYSYQIPEGLPPVWGNKDALIQVLYNLCNNAIEAMEGQETGKLELKAAAGDENCVITVKDTGKGMSKEELNNVAKPFFTTKKTGTGLGLFMTKEIIQEHDGSLHIDSMAGKGTVVTLSLPVMAGGKK